MEEDGRRFKEMLGDGWRLKEIEGGGRLWKEMIGDGGKVVEED